MSELPRRINQSLTMRPVFACRLEPDLLRVCRPEGQGSVRYDSSYCAPIPLPAVRLLLRPGGRVGCSHVFGGLIHPLCQLHVCKKHLSTGHPSVGKSSRSLCALSPLGSNLLVYFKIQKFKHQKDIQPDQNKGYKWDPLPPCLVLSIRRSDQPMIPGCGTAAKDPTQSTNSMAFKDVTITGTST